MVFLLAKMFLLLVLATVLGFLLGRWWVLRQFHDVTDEYARLLAAGPQKDFSGAIESLKTDVHGGRDEILRTMGGIEGRLRDLVAAEVARAPQPEIPKVDLSPLEQKILDVKAAVGAVRASENPGEWGEAARAQLSPQLTRIEAFLEGLNIPEPTTVDLTEVYRRLEAVEAALKGLEFPEPPPVDLEPVRADIQAVDGRLAEIRIPEPTPPDLHPLRVKLEALQATIHSLAPEIDLTPDLEPIRVRLAALEEAVRAIRIPPPTPVDLKPVIVQLSQFEQWVRVTLRPPPPPGPALFKAATFGPKDDLKRISGVGEVLERLLNELGVYYFFQVASWSKDDVQHVDDRLEVFKGRIERDNWVDQAKVLAKASRAKPPPGLDDTSFGLEPGAEYPPAALDALASDKDVTQPPDSAGSSASAESSESSESTEPIDGVPNARPTADQPT